MTPGENRIKALGEYVEHLESEVTRYRRHLERGTQGPPLPPTAQY
jgi:hypothetical protein